MANLNIQICTETGICSIRNAQGGKIDIIADEVDQLRAASGNPEQLKELISQVDPSFSSSLSDDDLQQLAQDIQ